MYIFIYLDWSNLLYSLMVYVSCEAFYQLKKEFVLLAGADLVNKNIK